MSVGALRAPENSHEMGTISTMSLDSAPPRLRVQTSANAERIVEIARAWIGTPYVHQASLRGAGCDCLGLIRGIWRELYGEEPEDVPPYSLDWAEATGAETLYMALSRHALSIPPNEAAAGDIALFRMLPRGPAKHCGVIGQRLNQPKDLPPPGGEADAMARSDNASGGGNGIRGLPPTRSVSARCASTDRPPRVGRGEISQQPYLTFIHSRQNKRVSEEPFSPFWRAKLAFVFRL